MLPLRHSSLIQSLQYYEEETPRNDCVAITSARFQTSFLQRTPLRSFFHLRRPVRPARQFTEQCEDPGRRFTQLHLGDKTWLQRWSLESGIWNPQRYTLFTKETHSWQERDLLEFSGNSQEVCLTRHNWPDNQAYCIRHCSYPYSCLITL
jgi:hypothetical protein